MDADEKAEVLGYINEVADRAEGARPTPMFDQATSGPGPGSDGHQPAAAHHLGVARDHAHMGTRLPSSARLRRTKLLMTSALRPLTSYQTTYNAELADALAELLLEVAAIEARSEARADARADARAEAERQQAAAVAARVNQTVAVLENRVTRLADQLTLLAGRLDLVTSTVEDQRAELVHLRQQVRTDTQLLRSRQDVILRSARAALPGAMGPEPLTALSRELSQTYDELYRDLETTFRGTRSHVRELESVYVDDVVKLGGGPVFDVGCGRGEWLEVLRELDIPAYGVETNEAFVARNTELGLDVRHGDALAHLRDLPEASLRAVTAFHVAEHLSLDTLVQLVDAALHALQPGGVLILETPNPTNIKVGAASFYLDPTHLKPLHPQFLEFLVTARGFVTAEIRYLHTEDGVRTAAEHFGGGAAGQQVADDLNWALFGPLDYAVVAHKLVAEPTA